LITSRQVTPLKSFSASVSSSKSVTNIKSTSKHTSTVANTTSSLPFLDINSASKLRSSILPSRSTVSILDIKSTGKHYSTILDRENNLSISSSKISLKPSIIFNITSNKSVLDVGKSISIYLINNITSSTPIALFKMNPSTLSLLFLPTFYLSSTSVGSTTHELHTPAMHTSSNLSSRYTNITPLHNTSSSSMHTISQYVNTSTKNNIHATKFYNLSTSYTLSVSTEIVTTAVNRNQSITMDKIDKSSIKTLKTSYVGIMKNSSSKQSTSSIFNDFKSIDATSLSHNQNHTSVFVTPQISLHRNISSSSVGNRTMISSSIQNITSSAQYVKQYNASVSLVSTLVTSTMSFSHRRTMSINISSTPLLSMRLSTSINKQEKSTLKISSAHINSSSFTLQATNKTFQFEMATTSRIKVLSKSVGQTLNTINISPSTSQLTSTQGAILNTTVISIPPTKQPSNTTNATLPPTPVVNQTTPATNTTITTTKTTEEKVNTTTVAVTTTTPIIEGSYLESNLAGSAKSTSVFVHLAVPFDQEEITHLSILVQEYKVANSNGNASIETWYQVNNNKKYRYHKYRAIDILNSKLDEFFNNNNQYVSKHRTKREEGMKFYLFKIGNGEACSEIVHTCNGPLKPETEYRFQLAAHLSGNRIGLTPFTVIYSTTKLTPIATTIRPIGTLPYGPSTTVLITLAVILVAFLLIVIIILVVVVRRRRRSRSICSGRASEEIRAALMGPCQKGSSKPRDSKFNGTNMLMERKRSLKGMTRPVSVRDFRAWVLRSSSDSEFRFAEEFESMRDVGKIERHEIADMPENRGKNRYVNILAYDFTRVKLSSIDDEPGSDYINANYIHGYKQPRAYIASQGPLPSTMDDFWRMTWEQNSRIIVMVTQCTERGRVKCHQYWPSKSTRYGDILVTRIAEYDFPEWIEREFLLEYEHETRHLKHFQYKAWPDHGVPKSTSAMLKFIQTIKALQKPEDGPLVCHCSAGVGRTGTYLCIDILMNKLQVESNVDVYGVVCMMRTQRCFMVQTEEQYIFIHRVVLDYLEQREQYSTLLSPNKRLKSQSGSDEAVCQVLLENEDADSIDIMQKDGFLSEFDDQLYRQNAIGLSETKT